MANCECNQGMGRIVGDKQMMIDNVFGIEPAPGDRVIYDPYYPFERQTQNAARAASARGTSQASAAQERLRTVGASAPGASASGIDTTTLLLIGGVLLVFMFMRR